MDRIPSILACDVGNSAIRSGCVESGQVSNVRRVAVEHLTELGESLCELWRQIQSPKIIVASSVNPAGLEALEAAAERADPGQGVLVVGRDLPLPIDTDLPNPEKIGTDRLCCAAGAFDQLGGACVVGDFGTAITIDCVSDKGAFLGGAILPGLGMGAECLHAQTAALPKVRLAKVDWVFGKDTQQAILAGLIVGARGALRELTEAYATELGNWPTVILTGSDAGLICPEPGREGIVQAIVPDLSLRGAAIAYYRMLAERSNLQHENE